MEEEVKEIAECSICIDLFTDPRMLPCIHTFCLKCITETSTKAGLKPRDSMPCPLCRTPFLIPMEGIVGLKKNFFIERLVEVVKMSKPSDKEKLCDICIEDNEREATEIPSATQFCIQCHKNICDRCCREHRRFQALKDHQLVPSDSPLKEDLLKRSVTQFCAQHIKRELEMFCINCKQATCVICHAAEHNSHKCSDIEKAADQFREEIKEDSKKMKKLSVEASEKYKKVIDEQKKLRESVENAEKAIVERGKELKEMIDRCTISLLDELAAIKQKEMKKLDTEKEESERHKASVESLVLYSDQLISKGSTVEICRNVSDLQSRNSEVQRLCQYAQKEHVSPAIAFQTSELEDFLKTKNIVGILKVKSTIMVEEKATEDNTRYIPVAVRSTNRLDLTYNSFATGFTKLLNKIYVPTYTPKQILVFEDQKPFRFQRKIEIREIEEPENIESSERSKSLFIFDSKLLCIWKMTIDDNRIIKWLSNVNGLFNISPLMDDQLITLIITAFSITRVLFREFQIYGSDRNLVRSLRLQSVIVNPWCCVQKLNGELFVSHTYGNSGQRTISQVNSDGYNIIRQITSENFANYSSLFLDSENCRLFAADYDNHRIVLFDSNSLELKQILLTNREHGISNPCKLFYDSKKMQLIVLSRVGSKCILNIYDLCMAETT